MGSKFLQQYGGLFLFLCADLVLKVTFDAETPLDNLPKLAIAVGLFVGFEVGLYVWLRLKGRPFEILDAANALLGVTAVSLAFILRGPIRLVGGLAWLCYQLLEGRLEERLGARAASRSQPPPGK